MFLQEGHAIGDGRAIARPSDYGKDERGIKEDVIRLFSPLFFLLIFNGFEIKSCRQGR
jgi:hypothetical protein